MDRVLKNIEIRISNFIIGLNRACKLEATPKFSASLVEPFLRWEYLTFAGWVGNFLQVSLKKILFRRPLKI